METALLIIAMQFVVVFFIEGFTKVEPLVEPIQLALKGVI